MLKTAAVLPAPVLKGTGTINGSLINNTGIVSPGNSPGTLRVKGDFQQSVNGTLRIEIAGTAPGRSDRLQVGGIDPLELEDDDVDTFGEMLQHVQVGVVADDRLGAGEHRRIVGGAGEHPHLEVERDRGLHVHPGQLSGAEDPDPRPQRRADGTGVDQLGHTLEPTSSTRSTELARTRTVV